MDFAPCGSTKPLLKTNPIQTGMMHIYFKKRSKILRALFGRNHRTSIRYSKTNPAAIIFCQGGQTDANFPFSGVNLKSVRQKIKKSVPTSPHQLCMIIRIRHIIEKMDMLLAGCHLKDSFHPSKEKDIYRNRSIFIFRSHIYGSQNPD